MSVKIFFSGEIASQHGSEEPTKWRITDDQDQMPADFQLCAEQHESDPEEGEEWFAMSEEDGDFIYRAAVQQLVDQKKIVPLENSKYIINQNFDDPFTGDSFEGRVYLQDGQVISEATMDDGTWTEVSDMIEYIDSIIYHQILVEYLENNS